MTTQLHNIGRFVSLAAALVSVFDLAGTVHAGSTTEPTWRLVRPTNTGILGDYVQAIFVDDQDQPWIGAYTPFWEEGGMSHFDGKSWLPLSNVENPVIASPRFNDIIKDAGGNLWIASDSGLLKYNPAIGASSLVRYDQFNTAMPASQIIDIDLAPDGAIWLAIHDVNSVPSGGLARFDPATGACQSWTTSTGLPWGAQWPNWDWVDHVSVVQELGGSFTVWFSSYELGVGTYTNGIMQWFGVPSEIPFGAPLTPIGLPSNRAVDNLNNLWLSTNHGLSRRAPNGTYLTVGYPAGLTSEVSTVHALSDGRAVLGTFYGDVFRWNGGWSSLGNWGNGSHTYAFDEDSTGALWVGGIGGAAKLQGGVWQRYRKTNTGMVGFWITTIAFDDVGNVYMDANAAPGVGGFDILHPDGSWTNANDFTYGLGLPWGLPTDDVADIVIRSNGHIALALNGIQGAVDFDGFSYTYLIPQGYDMLKIAEDGLGRIWASRYGDGAGIIRVTGAQMSFFSPGSSPLPFGQITGIIPDPDQPGFVWIVAPYGLAHTDGTTWNVVSANELGLPFISAADRAQDGTFWIGSVMGMMHFNPMTGQSVTYTLIEASLPSDDIFHVEVAPDSSVWVSTMDQTWPYPGGLTHFDGKTWTTYSQGSSPLPHNQVWALNSRAIAGGYEVWIGMASEAVAVINVQTSVPVIGDTNGDGIVNIDDLLAVIRAWGPCPPPPTTCAADIDSDGSVNVNDLLMVIAHWG